MGNTNVIAPVSNSLESIPVSIDLTSLFTSILNCYTNVAITKETQQTARTQIREQSRIYIASIEANTDKFKSALNVAKEERMKFIELACEIIRQREIDEYSLYLCERVLRYLTDTNPMNSIG